MIDTAYTAPETFGRSVPTIEDIRPQAEEVTRGGFRIDVSGGNAFSVDASGNVQITWDLPANAAGFEVRFQRLDLCRYLRKGKIPRDGAKLLQSVSRMPDELVNRYGLDADTPEDLAYELVDALQECERKGEVYPATAPLAPTFFLSTDNSKWRCMDPWRCLLREARLEGWSWHFFVHLTFAPQTDKKARWFWAYNAKTGIIELHDRKSGRLTLIDKHSGASPRSVDFKLNDRLCACRFDGKTKLSLGRSDALRASISVNKPLTLIVPAHIGLLPAA